MARLNQGGLPIRPCFSYVFSYFVRPPPPPLPYFVAVLDAGGCKPASQAYVCFDMPVVCLSRHRFMTLLTLLPWRVKSVMKRNLRLE